MKRPLVFVLPVALFGLLALIFFYGLYGNPKLLPSALVGKPVPAFALEPIAGLNVPGLSQDDLATGKVTIVNIWASWCGPCRDEHPILMQLAKRGDITLVGINNKDSDDNARRFLAMLGQPFAAIGADRNGRVTIDWGGYGVPETFVVDGKGIIRYRHVGPLTAEQMTGPFSAEIAKAAMQ